MKKYYFFLGVLFLYTLNLQAQFTDDMESYTDGEPINEGHWTDWGCNGGEGCSLMATTIFAQSGTISGLVTNDVTTDTVLDLGNKIFGEWGLEFWAYIPSGKEAYYTFQQAVPISATEPFAHTFFNKDNNSPGIGSIEDTALDTVTFDFPHDEWFRIVMIFDISLGIAAATWQFNVDGIDVLPPGTPFTNDFGESVASLGGIEFFSISNNNELYLDNFQYIDFPFGLSTDSFDNSNFKLYPNPSNEFIHIESKETINNLTIYSVLGNKIFTTSETNSINISSLSKGKYFVVVETEKGRGTQKLIKI